MRSVVWRRTNATLPWVAIKDEFESHLLIVYAQHSRGMTVASRAATLPARNARACHSGDVCRIETPGDALAPCQTWIGGAMRPNFSDFRTWHEACKTESAGKTPDPIGSNRENGLVGEGAGVSYLGELVEDELFGLRHARCEWLGQCQFRRNGAGEHAARAPHFGG